VEQVLPGDVGTSGRGRRRGKGHGRVNVVQILCTHVCKWKIETCVETVPGMVCVCVWVGEIKENGGGGE
jgi:hypothetical protein